MTESEIMNCAAILAAGILARNQDKTATTPEEAVNLMEEIAEVITDRQAAKQYNDAE